MLVAAAAAFPCVPPTVAVEVLLILLLALVVAISSDMPFVSLVDEGLGGPAG